MIKNIFTTIILLVFSIICYADIPISQITPRPATGGCLVNGVMYTTYVDIVYSGYNATNQTVKGYRYIYSLSGNKATCYTNRQLFYGKDPNNPQNIDIGCVTSNNYGSVYQTDFWSTYTFTVTCDLDNNLIFVCFACLGLISLYKKKNLNIA